jgi:dTDP-4-amino-4,6-dideoxygalactose transaminase
LNNPLHFIDLKRQYQFLENEIIEAIKETLLNAEFSGGAIIAKFERSFADYCGTKYCVAVNNGTSALHLAMITAGIKEGDEVILPANSFIATAWAPVYVGAKPVFVDCNPDDFEISIDDIKRKITKKTKAIIGVHLYGKPCDVEKIKEIADSNDITFIEDCAQSHGALFKGQKVGGFGKMGCFSFYPSKNLGTYGEGGAITTNDQALYERLLRLRNNGSSSKYHHDEIGFNYRMGGMEAAVLNVKLKYLDQWNNDRRRTADQYYKRMKSDTIRFQKQDNKTESVFHLFVITTPEREALKKHLEKHNIFPGIHYPVPCHLQKAFDYLGYKEGALPNAELLGRSCLSLPMYPELTDEELNFVIETLNKNG